MIISYGAPAKCSAFCMILSTDDLLPLGHTSYHRRRFHVSFVCSNFKEKIIFLDLNIVCTFNKGN